MDLTGFSKYKYPAAIALLFIIAFIIRIWPITVVHYWDETVYLQNAQVMFGLKADTYNELDYRPPLLSAIYGSGFLIWNNQMTASIIAALFGAAGVIALYFLGKLVYDKKTGIIAAILLCIAPMLAFNSWTLLPDTPSLTLLTIAAIFFVLYAKKEKQSFGFLCGVFISLTILMRFSAILYLAALAVLAVAFGKMYKQKKLLLLQKITSKPLWAGIIVTILPYLIAAQILFGSFTHPFLASILAVTDVNEPPIFYLLQIPELFSFLVITGTAAFIAIALFKKLKNHKTTTYCNWKDLFLILWLVLLLIILMWSTHKETRYLILPITIPLILISARGIIALFKEALRTKSKTIIAFSFTAILILGGYSSYPIIERLNQPFINYSTEYEEYQIASAINDTNSPPNSVIYTNFNYPVYAYYTNLNVKIIPPWENNFYSNYPANMPAPGFLIIYKNNQNQPQISWAEEQRELKQLIDTKNIRVYYYNRALQK